MNKKQNQDDDSNPRTSSNQASRPKSNHPPTTPSKYVPPGKPYRKRTKKIHSTTETADDDSTTLSRLSHIPLPLPLVKSRLRKPISKLETKDDDASQSSLTSNLHQSNHPPILSKLIPLVKSHPKETTNIESTTDDETPSNQVPSTDRKSVFKQMARAKPNNTITHDKTTSDVSKTTQHFTQQVHEVLNANTSESSTRPTITRSQSLNETPTRIKRPYKPRSKSAKVLQGILNQQDEQQKLIHPFKIPPKSDQINDKPEKPKQLPKTVRIGGKITFDKSVDRSNVRKFESTEKWIHHFKFFEIEHRMDPKFDLNPQSRTLFACIILLLFSVQLLLLALFMILKTTHVIISDHFWSQIISLVFYILLYILIRGLHCKYPENILFLIFMTFFILYSFGSFDYGSLKYPVIIYVVVITCTIWNIIVYTLATEMDVQSFKLYLAAIFYFVLFTIGTTFTTCLFVDKPGTPYYKVLDINLIAKLFPVSFLYLIGILFELQRIMRGRRISLYKNEWATATIILPFSILYPAYLIRKCKLVFFKSRVSHLQQSNSIPV